MTLPGVTEGFRLRGAGWGLCSRPFVDSSRTQGTFWLHEQGCMPYRVSVLLSEWATLSYTLNLSYLPYKPKPVLILHNPEDDGLMQTKLPGLKI